MLRGLRDILEEVVTMPAGLTNEQITNTVTWLARGRNFDRLVALDEFDMEIVAQLREHMRIPGVGTTAIAYYRDKLAMRMGARDGGFLVPEFVRVLNYDELRDYMDRVPAPMAARAAFRKPPGSRHQGKFRSPKTSGGTLWTNSATGKASFS